MRPFQDLTKTAQFRRLAALARHALRDYDLGDASLSPLQYVHNATWRVQCHSGQRYVLRIHYAHRFLKIVEPKIERYLRAAGSGKRRSYSRLA